MSSKVKVQPTKEVVSGDEGSAEKVGHLVPVVVGSQATIKANTYEVEDIFKKGTSIYIKIFRVGDEDHNTQDVRVGSDLWAKLFPNGAIPEGKAVPVAKKTKVIVEEDEALEFPDEDFAIADLDGVLEAINDVKSEAVRAVLYTSAAAGSTVLSFALETCAKRAEMPFTMETFEKMVLVDGVSVKRPEHTNFDKLIDLLEKDFGDEGPAEADYISAMKAISVEGQAAYFAMISENGWNLMVRPALKQATLEAVVTGFDDFDFEAEKTPVEKPAKKAKKEEADAE
jgi:hypothetical protein